jgi:serine/threonine protein kinase/Tol biopolymer transport system component
MRLGPYEIVAPVGAGGMGEVYRARDTRLDRTVAVKVLPEALEGDAQFRDRFEREARTISRLNHPNICVLHDVGHEQGVTFLVLEYLEGETLEQRLARGPLTIDAALKLALEIASALSAAHRAGIVHRDMKPGNIMVTRAGAKLLDFGLAKSGGPVITGTGVSMLPTTPALTAQGAILGTIQYMAPEQLEGKEADARADIFAFGAVLYEMIAGKKAFNGASPASVIAAIIHIDPAPIATLQPIVPPLLDGAIGKCLAKHPDERWQTVQDLAQVLRWSTLQSASAASVATSTQRARPPVWAAWSIAVLAAVTAGIVFVKSRSPAQVDPQLVRFDVVPPSDGNNLVAEDLYFNLSPDGRKLAFVATTENTARIWIRQLSDATARMLPGTEEARRPFWSPDSRAIGFFAGGKLKRIDLSGGSARILCDAISGTGGTWNRDGVILFATANSPLMRVAVTGGNPTLVTQLTSGQVGHATPQFLPDGRTFIYAIDGDASKRGTYLGALDTPGARKLPIASDGPAIFARPGSLLFRQQSTLVAMDFDPVKGVASGDPISLAMVSEFGVGGPPTFSVSETGVLAYVRIRRRESQLQWIDRKGNPLASVNDPLTTFGTPQIAPDGKTIASERDRSIWLTNLSTGTQTQLTTRQANAPVWSPDGRRIAFESGAKLFVQSATDTTNDQLLLDSPEPKVPLDWSPDGRHLLYEALSGRTGMDLWIQPLAAGKPSPLLETMANEAAGQFSPDGRWLAYQSDESGANEIYVRSFPIQGRQQGVSIGGGTRPRWRRDGRELLYLGPDARLMAAPIALDPQGSSLQTGPPVPLFATRLAYTTIIGLPLPNYAVTPDGQRFLMNVLAEGARTSPITVVLNWFEELKARVPMK